MATKHLNYIPYPVPLKFHQEHHLFLRALCGPFGSGKSVTCVEELLFIAMRQKPAADKVRYVRFGVVRDTYPALKTTTKKTMEMWYPEECGRIKESAPMEGSYNIPLSDGTRIRMELLLIAVDDEESVKKLRSTDFTAIWINEATEVSPVVLTTCVQRVGRFPSERFGACTWKGVILDYNMPPRGHWLRKLFSSHDTPENYKQYMQPPAMFKVETDDGRIEYQPNPDADNLKVLGGEAGILGGLQYYKEQATSMMLLDDYDGIDQLLCLLDVDDKRGKPVWPSFSRETHVAKHVITPLQGQDLIIAIDTSGIHPAALFMQYTGRKWAIMDELYGEGTGFEDFVYGALLPVIQTRYRGASSVLSICDPANARNSLTATTPVATLQEAMIPAQVAITNSQKSRIEAVSQLFNRDQGGLLISPNCELLIAACAGGYRYKKMQVAGTIDATYSATPEKNEASHPADALQYGALHVLRVGEVSNDQDAVRRRMRQRVNVRKKVM